MTSRAANEIESVAGGALEELIRLYFHLLDLSRDVERNKDDTAFAESGTIWYVLDATVLEVFINPSDPRGGTASLHSTAWSSVSKPEASWQSCAAQTALTTTEYLMTGGLPGQVSNNLYMTEWHRWEFNRRAETLSVSQISRVRRATRPSVMGRFTRTNKLASSYAVRPEEVVQELQDPLLADDLAEYQAHDADPLALRSYLTTRLALDVLANDHVVEPSAQLRRVSTAPLRHAFQTLHLAISSSTQEREGIHEDAQRWMRRLREECERRKIDVVKASGPKTDDEQFDGVGRRSEGALWTDALSLALVRWAAAKKSSTSLNERIVFVTADQIVFDTYRRWFATRSPKSPEYAEPFALRRIAQFAPAFNLIHSGRVEGKIYLELFQDLLQALEAMLLPLNLSRTASQAPDSVVTRMRELTALRPTEPGLISEDPSYSGFKAALERSGDITERRARIDTIVDRWRELERTALGKADNQIQNRIQDAMAAEEFLVGLGDDLSMEAYEKYVSDLVGTLLRGSKSFSLPMAREFIDNWPPPATTGIARAPIALQLTVEVAGRSIAVGDVLDDRLAGRAGPLLPDADKEAGWQALYERPALVFAIASAQCVTAQDWSNAHHFGEMALLAEEEADELKSTKSYKDQRAEIGYLFGLVSRFRMGEAGPAVTGEAFGRLERHYKAALTELNECEAYHRGNDVDRQELRLMRVYSERAALNLFFASAVNDVARKASLSRRQALITAARPGFRPRPIEVAPLELKVSKQAIAALESAEADLLQCMRLDSELAEPTDPRRVDFRLKVQRQYFTNIASASAVRALWGLPPGGAPTLLRANNREAVGRVRDVLARYADKAHSLMKVDILAFLAMAGDARALEQLKAHRVDITKERGLKLDLDMEDAISSNSDLFRPIEQLEETS